MNSNRKPSGCLSILLITIGVLLSIGSVLMYLAAAAGYRLKLKGVLLPVLSIRQAAWLFLLGAGLIIIAKTIDYIVRQRKIPGP